MNPYLIPALELGPKAVARIVRRINPARYDAPIDPDRFTIREVVAHLTDWEPIDRERLTLAVTSPGATIQPFDEVQMALDHGYRDTDIEEMLAVLERERKITTEYIGSLSVEQWAGHAYHPERGMLSAVDLANLIIGHDLYHIEQLSAYLE